MSKIFRQLILLMVLVAASLSGAAQVRQTHRYEVKHKYSDEFYNVISLEEEGIVLLREQDKYQGSKRQWEATVLDTSLQVRKTITFHLDERYPMIGYDISPERLFLLFRTGETNKNSLELIELDTKQGLELARYEVKPEVEFKITHFSKVGSSLALGGYVSNDPAILLYDMRSKGIKVVPGFFQKDNELVDLRVNENQTFNVILIDRSVRSDRKLVFRTFDESGKLLLEDIVPIDEQRALQTSISSTLQREDLLVAGTWGDRQGRQSTGFFTLPVDPFNDQKIRYYNFGEMKHFLDFMNPKRADRIKENTTDDVKSGRNPSYSAYVVPFKIQENSSGYYLLAEVYNPVSTTNPYYSNTYNNSYYQNMYMANPFWPSYYPGMRYRPYAYGSNVKNSDEIKTYATVLLFFDPAGNLKWDQSMKLEDIEKPALEQVCDFIQTGSNVYFLYKKESEIKIKSVSTPDNVVEETVQKIKMPDPTDEVRQEKDAEGGVKQWTENSFYVWGYQTIRNQQRKDDRIRDVFYINKVVVE